MPTEKRRPTGSTADEASAKKRKTSAPPVVSSSTANAPVSSSDFPRRRKAAAASSSDGGGLFTGGVGANPDKKPSGNSVARSLLKAGKTQMKMERDSKKKKQVNFLERAKEQRAEQESERLLKEQDRADKTVIKKLKCQPISRRRLEPGSLALAAVNEIRPSGLIVALPYGQVGWIPKEQCVDIPAFERCGIAPPDLADFRLFENYFPGQMVAVCVLRQSTKNANTPYVNIELSMRPSLLNAGLDASTLSSASNISLPVSILAEEDHVVKCSLGLEVLSSEEAAFGKSGTPVKGLLKKKHLTELGISVGGKVSATNFQAGRIVQTFVQTFLADSATAQLKLDRGAPPSNADLKFADLPLAALKPGMLVNATVKKVVASLGAKRRNEVPHGAELQFCGAFKGILTADYASNLILASKQVLPARILAVVQSDESENAGGDEADNAQQPKLVHLATLPHMLDWSRGYDSAVGDAGPGAENFPVVGSLVNGQVTEIRDAHCKISTEHGVVAVCPFTKVTDEKLDMGKIGEKVTVNEKVEARVLGFNALERRLTVGLAPNLVNAENMSHNQLTLGQKFRAEIVKVTEHGLIVKLSEFLTAEVPLEQLTNVPLKSVPDKFKEGNKINVRVLQILAHSNKVKCTAKKDFVKAEDSDLVCEAEHAKIGKIALGYISSIQDYGVLVNFFGRLHGLVPEKDPEKLSEFTPGNICKVRVCGVNSKGNLKLSFALNAAVENPNRRRKLFLQPGSKLDCTELRVTGRNEDGVTVQLPNAREAWIPLCHFSDDPVEADFRFKKMEAGKTVEECLKQSSSLASSPSSPPVEIFNYEDNGREAIVLSIQNFKHPTLKTFLDVISLKGSMLYGNSEFISEVGQVEKGKSYFGYVKSVTKDTGVFASLGGWNVVGLATKANVTDHFCLAPVDEFRVGQTVRCVVKRIDEETGKITLDMKTSKYKLSGDEQMKKEAKVLAHGLKLREVKEGAEETKLMKRMVGFADTELSKYFAPGNVVRGKVTDHRDYGIFVQTEKAGAAVPVLIMVHHLPDPEKPPAVGQQVDVFVLDFNAERKLVDGSLRTQLIGATTTQHSGAPKDAKKKKKRNRAEAGLASAEETQEENIFTNEKTLQDHTLTKNSVPLEKDAHVTAELQLTKVDCLVLAVADPSNENRPKIVYAPNADTWNALQAASVQMQRGSFAPVKIILQTGIEDGSWLARLPTPEDAGAKRAKYEEAAEGQLSKEADAEDLATKIDDPETQLAVGKVLKMRIHSIRATEVVLQAPINVWGHLHASDLCPETKTTSGFKVTDLVEVRVEKVSEKKPDAAAIIRGGGIKGWHVQVSMVPSAAGEEDATSSKGRKKKKRRVVEELTPAAVVLSQCGLAQKTLETTKPYRGAILSVSKDCLQVELNREMKGRLAAVDCGLDCFEQTSCLFEVFKAGQVLQNVFVTKNVVSKKQLDLSLVNPAEQKSPFGKNGKCFAHVQNVNRECTNGLAVSMKLPLGRWAQCHLADIVTPKPQHGRNLLKGLKNNQIVRVERVGDEEPEDAAKPIRVRVFVGDQESSNKTSFHAGKADSELLNQKRLSGVVVNCAKGSVFVAVTPTLVGRVQARNCVELFPPGEKTTEKSVHEIPIGTFLENLYVLPNEKDPSRLELSMTEKGAAAAATSSTSSGPKDLKVGQIVAGRVTAKKDFGLFVRIDGLNMSALAHVSELATFDSTIGKKKKSFEERLKKHNEYVLQAFEVGQKISRAKITKIAEDGKISLGLKAEYFAEEKDDDLAEDEAAVDDMLEALGEEGSDEEDPSDEKSPSDEEEAEVPSEEDEAAGEAGNEEDSEEEEEESDESDADVEVHGKLPDSDEEMADPEDEESDDDESDESDDEEPPAPAANKLDPLAIAKRMQQEASKATKLSAKEVKDSEAEEEVEEKAEEDEERRIQRREDELVDSANNPTSPDDFERLLLSEGKSSVVWIK